MIAGVSSGISAQFTGSANVCADKDAGFIFDSLLSGLIKGKEPAPAMQEELSVSPELQDPEENGDQQTMEQAYMNPFPYRILQDGKATVSVRDVPTDENAVQTGTWLTNVVEKQLVITDKLDHSVPSAVIPAQSAQIEDSSRIERLPLSESAVVTDSNGSQAAEPDYIPESIGVRAPEENEIYSSSYPSPRQQTERSLTGLEIRLEQRSERSGLAEESLTNFAEMAATVGADPKDKRAEQTAELQIGETTIQRPIADKEEKVDQPEAAAKAPDSNENKAPLNQGPLIRELATGNAFGHKPSKVTASHIETIQKTIEMQMEKTPVSGNTVVKILLTPDNIGNIHVQLVKTKESITAVLHVKDAETKGLLDEQLPLLMDPFRHSISESTLSIKVVTDASLAFSFSQGSDPGNRKAERQESRKRATRDKPETDESPKAKQTMRGLSLLA